MSRPFFALALAALATTTACSVLLGMEPYYEPYGAEVTPGGNDGGPIECVAGDFRCIGVELQACDRGRYRLFETCQEADKCSATGGNCQGLYCLPGQHRCAGDRLERCNGSQTAFDLVVECNVGLCDALGKQCNACVPNAKVGCADARTITTCSADGRTTTNTACAASTPNCVTNASGTACAQCGIDQHCSTTQACRAPKCINATCTTVADPSQDGLVLTPAPEQSCKQTVCRNGAPTVENLPANTKCGTGQGFDYFCNASGQCIPET